MSQEGFAIVSTNPQNLRTPNSRSATLSALLPASVVVIERRLAGDPAELKPAEAHYVARARAKRLEEFAAGRACARTALAEFGLHDVALPAAADRQPIWPQGFAGSITHTQGFCAAAVARKSAVQALGIDSELVGAPTPDIWPTLCRAEELAWIESLAAGERPAAATLVFSAKEAFYKCQYALTSEWMDFHDLCIHTTDWGRPAGTFTAAPTRPLRIDTFVSEPLTGRYAFHQQFVSAAVAAGVTAQ